MSISTARTPSIRARYCRGARSEAAAAAAPAAGARAAEAAGREAPAGPAAPAVAAAVPPPKPPPNPPLRPPSRIPPSTRLPRSIPLVPPPPDGGDQRCTSSRASRSASWAMASACCASRSASTGAERASPTAVSRCRCASASRVRASLPTAPRRVAMKSDAAAIPDRAASSVRSSWAAARSPAARSSCASDSAWSSAVPASSSRRSAASGSPPRAPSATHLAAGRGQRRLRPRRRGGELGAGEQAGLRQVRLDLGPRLDQPVRGLGQLVGEPPHPVEQRARLLDRLLRGSGGHRRVRALVGGQLGTGLVDLGAREVEPRRGLRDVVGDRLQRGLRVAGAQRVERRGGARDAAGRGVQLRLQAGEHLGQVLLEVAQAVEGGRLGVEALVRGAAQVQDLAEEAPPGGFVGLLVVDPLAQRERLHQLGPRLLQRGLEVRDRLVAELGAGEAELVLGGLHGVVEVDERAAGVVGEVVGRLAGGRVGERRRAPGAASVSAFAGARRLRRAST